MPAAAAASMPRAPCACAMTFRPSECAVLAMETISSLVKCASNPLPCCERTPPVAVILITSAPAFDDLRTFSAHSTGPVQVKPESSAAKTSLRKPVTSPCPPTIDNAGPAAIMRGPTMRPSAVPRRRTKAVFCAEPASRTVVKPALTVNAAFFTPMTTPHSSGLTASSRKSSPGSPVKWTCRSMRPGTNVLVERSTTLSA